MDFITELGIKALPSITIICYVIGMVMKAVGKDEINKWIPSVCGIAGGLMGVAALFIVPDYPATDYFMAFAIGAVSGLAATGFNQTVKQLTSPKT